MDLNRLPNDKKLHLCRWYFKGMSGIKSFFLMFFYSSIILPVGCILLPFVWAVNAVWFFREAFIKPPFDEQQQIKRYVIMSGAGAIVWAIILLSWVVTFQVQRVSWGSTGDALSFILPLGRA